MEFFAFLPAIFSCAIAIYAFISSFKKDDDYVWRFWKLLFGILFTILTIYLTNLGIEDCHRMNKLVDKHIYVPSDDWDDF